MNHPRALTLPRIGWCRRRWPGCSQDVLVSSWLTGWLRSTAQTISLCWKMGRCASTDPGLPSPPIPLRALQRCYVLRERKLLYEYVSDVALPAEHGALQALALPAPRPVVGLFQPVYSPGRAACQRLLRCTHRSGALSCRRDGADRAAGGDCRESCSGMAYGWLCRNHHAVYDERAATSQSAAARPEPARRECSALLNRRGHQPLSRRCLYGRGCPGLGGRDSGPGLACRGGVPGAPAYRCPRGSGRYAAPGGRDDNRAAGE